MRRGDSLARFLCLLCVAGIALAGVMGVAAAGEVRMNLGIAGSISTVFVDPVTGLGHRYVNCNLGDHVVWVTITISHTCTSGDSLTGPLTGGDGIWDSGGLAGSTPNNGQSFSWKATGLGTFPFFCNPHAPTMAGRVIVGTAIAVSDFRLSEVQYNEAAGFDKIEVTNIGTAAGDFGRYRFAVGGAAVSIAANSVPLSPGQTVTIHTNQAGTNTTTDIFLPALGNLGDAAGSVALYAPNTPAPSLTDATQMIDFVEWGSSGAANEATALTAGLWSAAQFAPVVAAGHSIEFCGDATQHAGRWFDNNQPNFSGAADNCIMVPVRSTTWGRIKTLYR